MKSRTLGALAALAGALMLASPLAATEVVHVGPDAAPISTVTVVKNIGGADMAYASGVPGAATAGDTKAQTIDSLTKLLAGLKAQGFGAGDVVMLRVFLVGDPAMGGKMDFAGMMAGYKQFFGTPDQPKKPSRTTVQIAALAAPGSLVEIEAQAVKPHM